MGEGTSWPAAGNIIAVILLMVSLLIVRPSKADEFVFAGRPNFLVGDIAADVLRVAYRRLGHTIKIEVLPAKRALAEANEGRFDGELARLVHVTKEYTNLRVVPVPVSAIRISVFSADPAVKISSWEDTKNYHAGAVIGFRYIESKIAGQRHTKTPTSLSLYRMLESGRVDIAIDSSLRGLKTIQQNGIKGVHLLSPPIEIVSEFHLLHKSKEYLIPKLTAILQDMENKGEIAKIYETHTARIRQD